VFYLDSFLKYDHVALERSFLFESQLFNRQKCDCRDFQGTSEFKELNQSSSLKHYKRMAKGLVNVLMAGYSSLQVQCEQEVFAKNLEFTKTFPKNIWQGNFRWDAKLLQLELDKD
jgi:hypothetical protein